MMDPETFAARLQTLTDEHGSITAALCQILDIPHLKERESERLLGHRLREVEREEAIEQGLLPTRRFKFPDGRVVDQDEFPKLSENADQLTEEVWTQDHYPDSYNDILEAVQKLPHGVVAAYYHRGQLNLVLMSPTGEKVGIRRTAFLIPTRSMLAERVAPLRTLKKAATA